MRQKNPWNSVSHTQASNDTTAIGSSKVTRRSLPQTDRLRLDSRTRHPTVTGRGGARAEGID
ncbi:hypothetical protein GCM10012280_55000 [Wenjunlia tyrosinilytica]|uniref:Uncharacterized protein n=1 Tax=Wenjunlia tyrosinilytica TaxID=1544741 RepID=A0A917ZW40_9ACTN|nr:hypothetical protein GCM10012280_55000 [Wenjunlia tyrosinilytica]